MNHFASFPQEEVSVRPNEWLGCGPFKPTKKWTKPIDVTHAAEEVSAFRPEGIHFREEWLVAGGEPSTPKRKWQKPKVMELSPALHQRIHNSWLGSPAVDYSPTKLHSPDQIKIEGMTNNIHNNPFFKNFGGL